MAKELLSDFAVVRDTFEQASDILNQDLKALCLSGPDEQLRLSYNQQPALLLVSVAAWRVLNLETGLVPAICAGHSLGEYSALVITNAMSFEKALLATRCRGELMESALPSGQGAMAAVLGMDDDDVMTVCKDAAEDQVLCPANFNDKWSSPAMLKQ